MSDPTIGVDKGFIMPRQCPSCGSGCGYTKTKGCQRRTTPVIDYSWILWQQACNAMQAEMLKELRQHLKDNAVTSHAEIDALLCEVTHPPAPQEKADG